MGGVALVLMGVYWWRNGGREQVLLALQPDFTITQIDRAGRTMILSRVQESFIVSCGNQCDLFSVGKSYSMLHHGGVLEFRKSGEKIRLPILQEHVDFETSPGGHG